MTAVASSTSPARTVHLLTLVVAGVFLLREASSHWFYLDEWDYLANRGVRVGGRHGVFFPHNEHWTTIPILIWRGIFNVVGVRDYWLYAVPLVVAHLVVAYLLWRLMVRHNVDPWTATFLVAAFAVLGVGSQELLRAFQIGFVGSLLFGLLAVEAVENDQLWLPAVWGVLAIMCSDIGVPMVVGAVLVAFARRKPRAAALAAVPPALVFLLWYEVIGRQGHRCRHVARQSQFRRTRVVHLDWSDGERRGVSSTPLSYVGAVLISILAGAAVVRRNVPAALAATTLALVCVRGIRQTAARCGREHELPILLPCGSRFFCRSSASSSRCSCAIPILRPFIVSGLVLLDRGKCRGAPCRQGLHLRLRQVEHTRDGRRSIARRHGGAQFPGEYPAGSTCTFTQCVN